MAYGDIACGTNRVNGHVATIDTNYAVPNYSSAYGKPTNVNVVRLPSNASATLKSQIDALVAGGNTSITPAMKGGVALLDPSLRATCADFISAGDIPSPLPARPFDDTDPKALKIVVLMTDDEHVSHNRITDGYKSGASPIYKSLSDEKYSIRCTSGRPAWAGNIEYYVPHLAARQSTPWNGGGGVSQQDWIQIWANLKMTYVAWQFYGRALGSSATSGSTTAYTTAVDAVHATHASVPDMEASLQSTCVRPRPRSCDLRCHG